MSEQIKPRTDRMSIMKLSTTSRKFLEKNPQIAKVAGGCAIQVKQLKDMLKQYDEVLGNIENFAPLQENGDREELSRFLSELNYNLAEDQIAIFENLPEGAFDEAVQKMGSDVLRTDVHSLG